MKFENRFSEMINRLLERPRLAGILVFLFLLLLIGFITNQKYQIVKENERQEMLGILNVVKQNIDQSLKNSYTSAFLLALTLDEEGNPVDFEKIGAGLKSNFFSRPDEIQLTARLPQEDQNKRVLPLYDYNCCLRSS